MSRLRLRAVFVIVSLLVASSVKSDITSQGTIHVTGSFAVKINNAHPDWTTPVLTLPAPPACSLASSDLANVSLNCGTWAPTVHTTVTAGGQLSRSRSVVVFADHFEVHDTFTSLETVLVFGVHLRNYIGTPSSFIMLAGVLNPVDVPIPWNPTAFTPLGNVGLGLVIEDDLFRIQGRADHVSSSATIGIKTDLLCLPPLGSQTLIWSIYPTATSSYYDFINRVRVNWNVNYLVPGSYMFWVPNTILNFAGGAPALAAALAKQGVHTAVLGGGWTDNNPPLNPIVIGFGTYVESAFFANYRTQITQAITMLRAASPGIQINLYYNWARDSTPSADTVYPDSLMTNSSNVPITNTFGGIFTTSWNTIPTTTNTYGIAMQAIANPDMLQLCPNNDCGLYIDEMETYDYVPSGTSPPWTYNQWDQKTCVLQTSGKVSSQISEVDLLSQTDRLNIAASMPTVMGNTPPLLRAFTDRHDMRFVEIEGNTSIGGSSRAGFSNLTSPLAYISSLDTWQTYLNVVGNAVLPVTNLVGVSNDMLPRMYPCTPEYLQPGTIRCDERITTTTSGKHGWTIGGTAVTMYLYDSSGHESVVSPSTWPVTNGPSGLFVQVSLGTNQAAVLVRTP